MRSVHSNFADAYAKTQEGVDLKSLYQVQKGIYYTSY